MKPFKIVGGGHGSGVQRPCIDLVKGQPVSDLLLIPLKNHLAVFHVQIDQAPVCPAIVFFYQGIRKFIMRDGHQRFHIIFPAAIKHLIIKCKSRLVWFRLLAGRKDPGPVDGKPEHLKTHFRKECDILLIVVVKINRFMGRIQIFRAEPRFNPAGEFMGAGGDHIRNRNTFSIHIPCALTLVGGNCAAPKKIIWKFHFYLFSTMILSCSTVTSPTSASFATRTGVMVGQPAALISSISNSSRSWPFFMGSPLFM